MELEILKQLTAIDSPTLNVRGVNQAQDVVAGHLSACGFSIERGAGENRFGDLLVAERPGRDSKFVTLVSHVDTVLANAGPVQWDGPRVSGAGVIDNKGGVAVGLAALRRALGDGPGPRLGLRFVSSPNEEMGSLGFTARYAELARSTAVALGLEPALDDGSIIDQRRGNRWYDVTITGRSAHAGRSFGHHANAAHDLARKIVRLAALTNYRKNISVSVGALTGGAAQHNVICGEATAKLDVRFPDFAARDRLHRKIEKILNRAHEVSVDKRYRTETVYEIVDDCPPFGLTPRAKRLARVFAALAGEIEGRVVRARSAGGAGDVNHFSTSDNVVLDGFGPVGGEMHTRDEFLHVSTLNTRAEALARFIRRLDAL